MNEYTLCVHVFTECIGLFFLREYYNRLLNATQFKFSVYIFFCFRKPSGTVTRGVTVGFWAVLTP